MTNLYQESFLYHQQGKRPGKISVNATKELNNQYDLSLAYSPGVGGPCLEIHKNIDTIYEYTSRGNTVAVVSNGTAVLGLGNLGAAASSPVMEGKAALFKKFADIDAIPILINSEEISEIVKTIKLLEYNFGAINLEDIKAPECFLIEHELSKILKIPVFHDDQHGTAVVIVAGLINALDIVGKKFSDIQVVVNGAGAAGIASIELLKHMGVQDNNIILCDTNGVIYENRGIGMNPWKDKHAVATNKRTLQDAMKDADVFIGVSIKDILSEEMVRSMNINPIIFALANPDPEITPQNVIKVRDDAIIATGRSDFPNQINNLVGFPYIFRGTLDTRAKEINTEMKIAAAQSIAKIARLPITDQVKQAYPNRIFQYGKDYITPTPFDARLLSEVSGAVAEAAMKTGAATLKFDIEQYKANILQTL